MSFTILCRKINKKDAKHERILKIAGYICKRTLYLYMFIKIVQVNNIRPTYCPK